MTPRRIIAIGLLFVVVPSFLISLNVHVPDFLKGLMYGLGIALEIGGLIKMYRFKKAEPEKSR